MRLLALGLAGVAVAAVLGLAAHLIARDTVGLSATHLQAGRTLAPPEAQRPQTTTVAPARTTQRTTTGTTTGRTTTTRAETEPGDDGGRGRGRGRSGDDDSSDSSGSSGSGSSGSGSDSSGSGSGRDD
jgi:uncharacterized membrane protein YgcG